jgi:hypothetical protein
MKAIKKPKPYYTYFGHIIWRNTQSGNTLRYSSLGIGAANTLVGMKKLIKSSIK